MGQTLRLVRPPVLWVVVEAGKPTPEAAHTLRRTTVMHCYVGCCDSLNASPTVDFRPHQLNDGFEVIENHLLDGVVYFIDEEGVYSLPLFDRLRQIRELALHPSLSHPAQQGAGPREQAALLNSTLFPRDRRRPVRGWRARPRLLPHHHRPHPLLHPGDGLHRPQLFRSNRSQGFLVHLKVFYLCSIPKSIVHCQVHEVKRSLLDHFFTELGAREIIFVSVKP
ncbi:uncharacterized protein [Aegilops tauschii subsp. strangulata]|uniref:uncharacterized protein isoform X1 n=1 Tax=Aegilops tauschii subsp. strangulata TaxID=200361 RepID=UPI002347DC33